MRGLGRVARVGMYVLKCVGISGEEKVSFGFVFHHCTDISSLKKIEPVEKTSQSYPSSPQPPSHLPP